MCPSPHGYGPMGSTPNAYPQDMQLIRTRPCWMREVFKLQHMQVSTDVGLLVFIELSITFGLLTPRDVLHASFVMWCKQVSKHASKQDITQKLKHTANLRKQSSKQKASNIEQPSKLTNNNQSHQHPSHYTIIRIICM